MSAAASMGPQIPGDMEKMKGLLSRMKSVLKRSDGTKRLSLPGKQSTRRTRVAASASQPEPVPVIEAPAVVEECHPPGPHLQKIPRSQIETERAQKLRQRLSVQIEPLWSGPDEVAYRIEKPIKMRIHRSCHKCSTSFGCNKICIVCEHVRCKHCPRHPVKNIGSVESTGQAKVFAAPVVSIGSELLEADQDHRLREPLILTRPSLKPNGQPLVRKKPNQQVRRTCHECMALFGPGCKRCLNCDHIRCVDCPRDPVKKNKYPDGYPGDAFSSNIAQPVKYSCHQCSKVFPAVPHPSSLEGIAHQESGVVPPSCARCHHTQCFECPRARPSRVEPAPDPEVLRSVQAKLTALDIAGPVTV